MTAMETSLRKRIDQLLAEKRELQETLRFYGDPDHYKSQSAPVVISEGQARISTTEPLVMLDGGRRAREAR